MRKGQFVLLAAKMEPANFKSVKICNFPLEIHRASMVLFTGSRWRIRHRLHIDSSIAQLVEHAAVNRRVVGSSPTWGARAGQCGNITKLAGFFVS